MSHTTVVFDGYESSTKDHDHRRRRKLFCHDMKMQLNNIPYASKDKFISNAKNKTELSDALNTVGISTICCKDDADTSIVKSALQSAKENLVEVRAEDADVLIMLVHHITPQHHFVFFTTTKGTFNINQIKQSLTQPEQRLLMLLHAFTGCDTVSSIYGFNKGKLFKNLVESSNYTNDLFEIFIRDNSSVQEISNAGIRILQIYL